MADCYLMAGALVRDQNLRADKANRTTHYNNETMPVVLGNPASVITKKGESMKTIRLRAEAYHDRMNLVLALANNGYPVMVKEMKKPFMTTHDFYVYVQDVEIVEDEKA